MNENTFWKCSRSWSRVSIWDDGIWCVWYLCLNIHENKLYMTINKVTDRTLKCRLMTPVSRGWWLSWAANLSVVFSLHATFSSLFCNWSVQLIQLQTQSINNSFLLQVSWKVHLNQTPSRVAVSRAWCNTSRILGNVIQSTDCTATKPSSGLSYGWISQL